MRLDYYVFDSYSIVHFWWGTCYGLFPLLIPSLDWGLGFVLATAIAIVWEWIENTRWWMDLQIPCMSVKKVRDTWQNSVGDVVSSSLGYGAIYLARKTVLAYYLVFTMTTACMLLVLCVTHYISKPSL